MSKDTEVNNQKGTPDGQVPKANQETVVDTEPSFDELRKTVMKMSNDEPQNLSLDSEPEEEVTEESSEVEEENQDLPDELQGKTPQELAKMYQNLRQMQSKQAQELGELRKLKEKQDELKKETEKYSIDAASRELVNTTINNMTKEEADGWLDQLTENPRKALAPMILEIVGPLVQRVAKANNDSVEKDLIERTRDSLVPYEKYKDEINQVLDQKDNNGRRYLFDRFGSKAFEEAYRVVYDRHFESERKSLEEQARKAREEAPSPKPRKTTFVQQQTNASNNRGSNTDTDDLSFEEFKHLVKQRTEAERR